MVDTVKDIGSALAAMTDALKSDTRTKGMTIARMAPANEDPGIASSGWIGLYADTVNYEPRSLGTGTRGWRFTPTFRVIVQRVSRDSFDDAHNRLEDDIKSVLDVIFSNSTLSSVVEAMTHVSVTYAFSEDSRASMYFLGALLTLEFVGTTD